MNKNTKNSKTYYLIALPSFVEGMARIFDFASVLPEYNYIKTSENADHVAIKADWEAVGEDLLDSFEIVGKIKVNEKEYSIETSE